MNKIKAFFCDPCPVRPDYAAAGDLLRVFCVFMIAWYHIWQQSWLSPKLQLGRLALDATAQVRAGYMFVDLMLMLSGFLLYLPYANGRERPARAFYLRRARRILPSYWLCLIVMVAFALAKPDASIPALLKDLAAHLSFTHNLFYDTYIRTSLNVVLWTLAVEVQFYLLLPVIAPVFRKRPVPCYLAMVDAALCFQRLWTYPMADSVLFINRLPNMLDVYANGMLAAHLYAALSREEGRRAPVTILGTLACAAGAWGALRLVESQSRIYDYDMLRLGQLDRRFLFSLCGAAFLAGGSLSFAPIRRLLSNRFVRFLSGLSFNFYIWHQWLAVKLKQWRIPPYLSEVNPNQAGEMPWQLHYTLLCFLAALAAAALATYLVERPCAKWLERRATRGGR